MKILEREFRDQYNIKLPVPQDKKWNCFKLFYFLFIYLFL